jgi:excisionase family DNA binding protein
VQEYLTISALAEYSSLSESSLRSLVRSGELPAARLRRKILVRRTDFDWWARRRQREHGRCSPAVKKLADLVTGAMS